MSASGIRQPRWRSRLLLLAILLMVLSPFGYVAGRSLLRLDGPSPAVGRAQVITQGIAELPAREYVMRVIKRTAPALGDAKIGRRALGVALATDEPILITDVTGEDEYEDVARLAPGEAYLTHDGTRQIRASLSGQSANYIGIEFVPPDQANDVGTGELLFVSDVLTSPAGQHDIDLVRNVLAQTDLASVPNTDGQILVLATDGAIDILAERSGERRLAAGESAIYDAEELEISASENSVYGVPSNQLGSLTSMLQTDDPVAGYVVIVIGPEVPRTGEPTPTAIPQATATLAPSAEPVIFGSIGVSPRLCNPGVTIETISAEECPPVMDGYDLSLTGAGINLSLANASLVGGQWTWSALPLGTFRIAAGPYPRNANDYFIPGSAAVGGSSAEGYTVTINPAAPDIALPLYFLQPQPRVTTSAVTFTIQACQQGLTNCGSPASYNVDPQPYLVGPDGQTLNAGNAQRSGDSYTWSLPAGTWSFYQGGWQNYYYVDGVTHEGGTPYVFAADGANPQSHLVQDEVIVIE
jgi:hypothetical protein